MIENKYYIEFGKVSLSSELDCEMIIKSSITFKVKAINDTFAIMKLVCEGNYFNEKYVRICTKKYLIEYMDWLPLGKMFGIIE